jgi:hypothetical protein
MDSTDRIEGYRTGIAVQAVAREQGGVVMEQLAAA